MDPSRSNAAAEREYALNEPELVAMREEDAARDAALERFSPRAKERCKYYVIGAVIFFPLITWFFTPAGFQMLWLQIPIAAAYGAVVSFLRPTGITAVALTLLAGLAVQAVTGHLAIGFGLMMSMIIYGVVGQVVGIGELSKVIDGR